MYAATDSRRSYRQCPLSSTRTARPGRSCVVRRRWRPLRAAKHRDAELQRSIEKGQRLLFAGRRVIEPVEEQPDVVDPENLRRPPASQTTHDRPGLAVRV